MKGKSEVSSTIKQFFDRLSLKLNFIFITKCSLLLCVLRIFGARDYHCGIGNKINLKRLFSKVQLGQNMPVVKNLLLTDIEVASGAKLGRLRSDFFAI